jgi:hypothetical protein
MSGHYELQIIQSSGEQRSYPLSKSEVTVGSDPRADICLVGEAKLLPQHILIAARADQCWISTASGAPLWDQEGQAVEGAYVPWGTQLSLGNCQFTFQRSENKEEVQVSGNPKEAAADKPDEATRPSPLILMLLVSALAFAGIQLLHGPESSAGVMPPDAPELFESKQECTSKNALHRAALAEEEAFARSERSVFEKQDGISAVQLFEEAEACYRQAKQKSDADALRTHGNQLRQALEEEYKLLRMRLSRALNEGDRELATLQLRRLLDLLRHRAGTDYVLALRRLELHLSKEQLP